MRQAALDGGLVPVVQPLLPEIVRPGAGTLAQAHGPAGLGVPMIEGQEGSDLGTVTDALSRNRDLALARSAERAAKTSPGLLIDTMEAEAGRWLAALLDGWRVKYPDVPVSQEVVHGHPGRTLVGLSARADLVVLGRHVRHSGPPGPGTVTHAVLNHAHGPVVTVPSS